MKKLLFATIALLGAMHLTAQRTEITVDATKKLFPIQPTMYGLFFEDINFGADGGLYAELIKNRSFDFTHPMVGWLPFGDVEIASEKPCFDRNPRYARLTFKSRNLTGTGLENEGFRGIGFKKGENYKFSLYARNIEKTPMRIRVELVSHDQVVATTEVTATKSSWEKLSATLSPSVTDLKGKIRITLVDRGEVDLDHISLFPADTWKGREGGLRRDLAQALYDIKPGVFRFPGGCIVEGTTLETRYNWKNSVGAVENRPVNINRWNYTFNQSRAYDYFQSYGLGFYEYFLLSEDIGAEPLPVISCGLACQFENRNNPEEYCSVENLQPFIDDALDLIEFANGAVSTKWGKVRADMGHPAPFNMKFIAVGNEQWGDLYPPRLEPFIKAIKAKYPKMNILGSAGPSAAGKDFDYGWEQMRRLNVDLVDEHYYQPPSFFYNGATRYDNYDRTGPKVFAGEYAAHHPTRANNFDTALSEAAFMTGLERNADVVLMATYAPLFAHIEGWQWRPDLIWFDNLNIMKSPNYYVQQMYGRNTGDFVIPILSDGKPLIGQNSLYASASVDSKKGELIIKIVNSSNQDKPVTFKLVGVSSNTANVITLQSDNMLAENSLANPTTIATTEGKASIKGNVLEFNARAQSFNVLVITN